MIVRVLSLLFSFLLVSPAIGRELRKILPVKPEVNTKVLQKTLDLVSSITPENLENAIQTGNKRAEVELLPFWYVNFLPFGEYYIKWNREGSNEKVAVVRGGSLTVKELYSFLRQRGLAYRKGKTLIFKVPVYISPGASLTVEGLKWGLGAPVVVSGLLYIKDSRIFPWDFKKNRISKMPELTYKDYYLLGKIPPRPYIKTMRGGKLVIVNSEFKYLGFRGLSSSFGVSVVGWPFKKKFVENPLLYLLYSYKWHRAFGLNRLISGLTKEKTAGLIVGSDFIENFMGFFSNEADDVFIVGNLYKDNYQYNIDPHDWTRNILIAYNWVEGAHKAHGIIFSRFVRGAVIGNISINNHGAGAMMDRRSRFFIYRNLFMNNRLGGISLLESGNNILIDNIVMRNRSYGIFIRNSLGTYLRGNQIIHNVGFGEEVAIADLSNFTYRNLIIDKYRMASSAWNRSNTFVDNLNGEIKSIKGAFYFYKNRFKYLYLTPFLGDLSPYTKEILNQQNKEPVVIPGKGNFNWIGINLPNVKRSVLKLERYLWKKGNGAAVTEYSLYLLWGHFDEVGRFLKGGGVSDDFRKGFTLLVRRASEGDRKALTFLGVFLLGYAPDRYTGEALTLISEGALLGSPNAQYLLTVLPLISGVSEKEVESAVKSAVKRVESGRLVSCKSLGLSSSFCSYPENFYLLRERERNIVREKFVKGYVSFVKFFKDRVVPLQKRRLKEKIASMKALIKRHNAKFNYYFSHKKKLRLNSELYVTAEGIFLFKREAKRRANALFQKEFLKKHREQDLNFIKPRVREFVSEFNRFRKRKLSPEEALKLLEEKCFDVE